MVRLIVDSSSDYTKEELDALNLSMVPLQICINDHNYLDGIDLTKDAFYELLVTNKEFPKTSQPSPNAFLDLFEEAKSANDEVVCILLSSALSGTYQSAKLAKEMCEYDGIYLIDTLSATAGIRILAERAIKLKNENKSAKEIADELESVKSKIRILAGIETLEYLCKGGRVSKASATIGGLANIKPLITVSEEGKVEVIAKKRGTQKAISYIEEEFNKLEVNEDYDFYSVYTYGTDNTQKLEERLSNIKITKRVQIGPTIGAHVGPGAFGIIFIEK